jgi:predicted AAA+ superfamily ATPase
VLERRSYLLALTRSVRNNPVTAILGPRQCGKTTLARAFAAGRRATFFDLENPRDRARLAAPMAALERLSGLIVLDEIQRMPELFGLLRVLVDQPSPRRRFVVLGSASPRLVRGASESLAGRVGFVDLGGFDLREVGQDRCWDLWLRGGLPRSFLAPSDPASMEWREDFMRTFLERDIPQLGIGVPPETLRRFWTMVAHYHGQTWNASQFARSLGASEPTARRYLDILSGAYVVRQLPPWFENLRKRQVKAPKVYLRDSGLLHALLGIANESSLLSHAKAGASWEGFAIEQILATFPTRDAYCWATHGGAEIDLLLVLGGRRYGIECKLADAPTMTRSLAIAMQDLRLDRAFVIYPGEHRYLLTDKAEAVPLRGIGALRLG